MRRNYFISALSIAMLVMVVIGCKKSGENITVPPEQAHFANQAGGTYFITGPTVSYAVPVGITNVSNTDRTINVTVTSPTGAVQGTHYTLNKTTVTIPAGQALDSIVVQGVQSQYLTGRKDTLIFTITDAGVKPSTYNSTFRLLMRGPCFEGDVDLNELLGDYNNTHESGFGAYGPYTTSVTAVSQTSATTGTITVSNIYDNGWNPIVFKLDWTDPNNRTVTLDPQTGIGNAGTLSSTYAGQDIQVRGHSNGQVGTFSVCGQTIRLVIQAGVTGLGWFSNVFVVNMAR